MRINSSKKYSGFAALIFAVIFAIVGTPAFAAQAAKHSAMKTADVARDPSDLPPTVGNRAAGVVHVTLTAREVIGQLDASSGATYRYWTFNGKVPGPLIRVRQGDTVVVTLNNDKNDTMVHSIDLHAALGQGGGAALSQVPPGQSKTFSFMATTPGLFVYHCGTPMVAEHMANGMYGLILVEPPGGLPHVDHEYYIMQGEIYTASSNGRAGLRQFSSANLLSENAQYFIYNGSVDAVNGEYPLKSTVGDTVRIFLGNGGPNATASEHMIGEIFSKVYPFGSLTSVPLTDIQTVTVPPGGATILELKTSMPGRFTMMDHAIARMEKGLMAVMNVTGPENTALMKAGPTPPAPGAAEIGGMTLADARAATENDATTAWKFTASDSPMPAISNADMSGQSPVSTKASGFNVRAAMDSSRSLVGCITALNDGRVMLRVFRSEKVYRLEAQPLAFSRNLNRLVHVTGYLGSVVAVEDPRIPSFVVDNLEVLAPSCTSRFTMEDIERALAPAAVAPVGATVLMGHMNFMPATVTIEAGQQVVWKNTSDLYHNVVANPGKVSNAMDVRLPSGAAPFASEALQTGAVYSHVFDKPGTYHYVCTLHESNGMKGTVIVRPARVLAQDGGTAGTIARGQ